MGFVEICSYLRNDVPIYNGEGKDGKEFSDNFYKGIPCDCKGK